MSDHTPANSQLQFTFSETKTCLKCGEAKPLSAFGKDKFRPDGLSGQCRACRQESDRSRYVPKQRQYVPKPIPVDGQACTKCKVYKSLSEFTLRQSGKLAGHYETQCRACKNALNRAHQTGNPDSQKRNRENMRVWRERNREWYLKYKAEYDANYRERRREQARTARAKYPQREMAHTAVRRAVQRGDLPPAWVMVCDICQEAQALEYHHHKGYEESHWLDVVATCLECHGLQHRKET